MPENWDMIWLEYNNFFGPDNSNIFNKPYITNNKKGINICHHCYLFNSKSFQLFTNILFPFVKNQTKDEILRNNFDNAYFLFKKIAFQNIETFKISTRTTKKMDKKIIKKIYFY